MNSASSNSTRDSASEGPRGDGTRTGERFTSRAETDDAPGRVSTPSGDLYYLNASGPLREMGRQTGEKLADLVPEGPVAPFSTFLSESLRRSPMAKLSNLARWASSVWATDDLVDQLEGSYRRAVDALADTLPLSRKSLLEAYTLPEGLLWLIATIRKWVGTDRTPGLGRTPIGGATSAVVTPPSASTTYHARNFDYYGFGPWERTACVQFYHPDSGLDYVSVGAAGLFGGGYTAMNAAGLTLAAHQHPVDEFDFDGVPAGVAGDRAIRRARSIDEAVEILRDHPPVAGWSYVLTQGDRGNCAILEQAPGHDHLHRLPEDRHHLAHTNLYRSDALRARERDLYPEQRRRARARQTRALELTGDLTGAEVTAESMAGILADFFDSSESDERLLGRSIASVRTVSSVVFEPEQRRLWVGSGPSPASRSWFVPFRFRPSDRLHAGGPDPDADPFHPAPGWDRTSHGKAFDLYREACVGSFDGETDKRLLIRIEHALALFPTDPALHLLGGLLALRLGRGRRAEGAFRRALERFNDLPRRAEATLYLGWALDLQDQRSAARQRYRDVLRMTSADPAVRRRARRGRWIAFSAKRAARISIDFVHVGAY